MKYVWSCQYFVTNNPLFVSLCVVVVCLHLFMLAMGSGIYSVIYSQIQVVSLLMWVNLGDWSIAALQGTNFGILNKNSFSRTYGAQMVILMFVFSIFFFIIVATSRTPHNPTAILLRRKRVIFPLRISILTINMLFFTSIVALSTITNLSGVDILELFLAILGLLFAVVMFIWIFFVCNFKVIKLDDPNYYPICEKMISTRWWVRNNLFFQTVCFLGIILSFVLGFQEPAIAIIPILLIQALYTVYLFLFLSFVKLRYKIILTLSNLIFLAILFVLNGMTAVWNNSTIFYNYSIAYFFLIVGLCALFIIANIIEIVAQRFRIKRLLKSIKNRFILCEKLEKQVEINKYDSTGRK